MSSVCLDAYIGTLSNRISPNSLRVLMITGAGLKRLENSEAISALLDFATKQGHLTIHCEEHELVTERITDWVEWHPDDYHSEKHAEGGEWKEHHLLSGSYRLKDLPPGSKPVYQMHREEWVTVEDVAALLASPLSQELKEAGAVTVYLSRWLESHGVVPNPTKERATLQQLLNGSPPDTPPPVDDSVMGRKQLPDDYEFYDRTLLGTSTYSLKLHNGVRDFDGTLRDLKALIEKSGHPPINVRHGKYSINLLHKALSMLMPDVVLRSKSSTDLSRSR